MTEYIIQPLKLFPEAELCLQLMEETRRRAVLSMKYPPARNATIQGEWLVKSRLAALSGKELSAITLARTEKGKPYAVGLPIEFSLSHSKHYLAAAFSDAPIGIDIEELRPIDLRLAERCCTAEELEWLHTQPDLNAAFFNVWTAKEAYFKCCGSGITDLRSIDIFRLQPRLHTERQGDLIISIYE